MENTRSHPGIWHFCASWSGCQPQRGTAISAPSSIELAIDELRERCSGVESSCEFSSASQSLFGRSSHDTLRFRRPIHVPLAVRVAVALAAAAAAPRSAPVAAGAAAVGAAASAASATACSAAAACRGFATRDRAAASATAGARARRRQEHAPLARTRTPRHADLQGNVVA